MRISSRPLRRRLALGRRGSTLPYLTVAILTLIAFVSVAVDWGRVTMVKSDMQRCADATARATWSCT